MGGGRLQRATTAHRHCSRTSIIQTRAVRTQRIPNTLRHRRGQRRHVATVIAATATPRRLRVNASGRVPGVLVMNVGGEEGGFGWGRRLDQIAKQALIVFRVSRQGTLGALGPRRQWPRYPIRRRSGWWPRWPRWHDPSSGCNRRVVARGASRASCPNHPCRCSRRGCRSGSGASGSGSRATALCRRAATTVAPPTMQVRVLRRTEESHQVQRGAGHDRVALWAARKRPQRPGGGGALVRRGVCREGRGHVQTTRRRRGCCEPRARAAATDGGVAAAACRGGRGGRGASTAGSSPDLLRPPLRGVERGKMAWRQTGGRRGRRGNLLTSYTNNGAPPPPPPPHNLPQLPAAIETRQSKNAARKTHQPTPFG